MELLIVTLAYTSASRDTDMQAQIRLIAETVRNTPGVISVRIYRGQGPGIAYFMLSTWEDEDSWRRHQEQHDPRALLLALPDLLKGQPEQWQMHYLWGYSRPASLTTLSAAHIATIHPSQVDLAQRGWISGLRQQATAPTLSFAFLARGMDREDTEPRRLIRRERSGAGETSQTYGSTLLSFFSWASEREREEFYTDPYYQSVKKFLESVGVVRILPLDSI